MRLQIRKIVKSTIGTDVNFLPWQTVIYQNVQRFGRYGVFLAGVNRKHFPFRELVLILNRLSCFHRFAAAKYGNDFVPSNNWWIDITPSGNATFKCHVDPRCILLEYPAEQTRFETRRSQLLLHVYLLCLPITSSFPATLRKPSHRADTPLVFQLDVPIMRIKIFSVQV